MTPLRRRALRDGLTIAGVVVTAFLLLASAQLGDFGFDARSYWGFDFSDLYRGTETNRGLGPFRYSPVIAQLLAPLSALEWWQFLWLWVALLVGTLIWLGGRWTIAILAFPPVAAELIHGNIHLLMAAAIVLGFRHPWTWSLILLTKVTPGIGLLWFVVRREWRHLAIALGATAALVVVSAAFTPHLWSQWVASLAGTQYTPAPNEIAIPLLVRLPVAAAVVIWGAATNRAWTVPVAVTLALPTIWMHGLTVLVAAFTIERARLRGTPVVPDGREATRASMLRAPAWLPGRTAPRRLTPP